MTDYLSKLALLNKQISHPQVATQVKEINQIVNAIAARELLKKAPVPLGLLPDQYEQILEEIGTEKSQQLKITNKLLNSLRQFLSLRYGIWSVPNLATIQQIQDEFHPKQVLEIMAGNAYWSLGFKTLGIETIATDSNEWAKTSQTGSSPFIPVFDYDAISAIRRFTQADLILCSWAPNFTKDDLNVVQNWQKYNPHATLLFVGEKDGATNSPDFWHKQLFSHSAATTRINDTFKSFDFIDEQIFQVKQ